MKTKVHRKKLHAVTRPVGFVPVRMDQRFQVLMKYGHNPEVPLRDHASFAKHLFSTMRNCEVRGSDLVGERFLVTLVAKDIDVLFSVQELRDFVAETLEPFVRLTLISVRPVGTGASETVAKILGR